MILRLLFTFLSFLICTTTALYPRFRAGYEITVFY